MRLGLLTIYVPNLCITLSWIHSNTLSTLKGTNFFACGVNGASVKRTEDFVILAKSAVISQTFYDTSYIISHEILSLKEFVFVTPHDKYSLYNTFVSKYHYKQQFAFEDNQKYAKVNKIPSESATFSIVGVECGPKWH